MIKASVYQYFKVTVLILLGYYCLIYQAEAKSPPTLHLIGDSTMASRDHSSGNPEYGWGEALHRYFKEGVSIKNHAKGGRSAKSFMIDGHWETAKQEINEGDWVLIQFGHNDQKKQKPNIFAEAKTEYKNLLQEYILETKEYGANPIIATSIYRRRFHKDGTLKDTLGEYPLAAREIAQALNVPLVDMHRASGSIIQALGIEGSKQIFLHLKPGENNYYPKGKNDNSHLSKKGAEVIAEAFVIELRRKNTPLTEWLVE
ncbi:rhamnogalacturonan acetylesterase [Rubellicoccus peritrichatus]|uniref:Rhamnogalacturonan acetylesterase n=1 Tax=Rubellicoccus peritrichatus TaxID=3080537 RepID=A0AAQ3LCH4_9BACT|nr:rhamnogalacturonan acetylesterase [Puniceicoccus sp. CR14]WOO43266.1 rhamnogalacturonan acetylesterase [Puniceicoccus sp. CR14]